MVNFATLSANNNETVTENELRGKLNITAFDERSGRGNVNAYDELMMYGAYHLGPSQAGQIDRIGAVDLGSCDLPAAHLNLIDDNHWESIHRRSNVHAFNSFKA